MENPHFLWESQLEISYTWWIFCCQVSSPERKQWVMMVSAGLLAKGEPSFCGQHGQWSLLTIVNAVSNQEIYIYIYNRLYIGGLIRVNHMVVHTLVSAIIVYAIDNHPGSTMQGISGDHKSMITHNDPSWQSVIIRHYTPNVSRESPSMWITKHYEPAC